jgi:transcriptional regulator with XRE-family HTH domain
MSIGSIIKSKRKQKDLTQEQFAEYLNVSVSAVSQWESDKTIPDYSLLIPLANFFDITLDELLGRTPDAKEMVIDEYNKTDMSLANEGKNEARIEMWREALKSFPGDYHCMTMLANSLFLSLVANSKDREDKARECVSLCDRILRDCTETGARESAVQTLVYIYSMPDISFASESKAVEYASKAGSMLISSQYLLETAYFSKESRAKRMEIKHDNRIFFLSHLTASLVYDPDISPEEHLSALECALKLWKTVFYDDNFLVYHSDLQDIYFYIARIQAGRKNKKEAIDAIEKMLFHAHSYDLLPPGEKHYTSSFISAATSNIAFTSKNYSGTNISLALNLINQKEFDFIRNDPDYLALVEKYIN